MYAENGMIDIAIGVLKEYGIDYDSIQAAKGAPLCGDLNVIKFILQNLI